MDSAFKRLAEETLNKEKSLLIMGYAALRRATQPVLTGSSRPRAGAATSSRPASRARWYVLLLLVMGHGRVRAWGR